MAQLFKGDELELKFFNTLEPVFRTLSLAKSEFFDEAYFAYDLGRILFESGRAPLTNAIPEAVFKDLFSSIFSTFYEAGTAESYLTVFRAVFGNDVEVTLAVPAPGKLTITIHATGIMIDTFVARTFTGSAYTFDDMETLDSETIVFRSIKGLNSQYEVEQMLFELVPDGIYTQITLTLG